MHAPPEKENPSQFVRLAEFFCAQGIAVPRLHAHDCEHGFVLMEDLGDDLLEKVYARPDANHALELAIRTLISIQSVENWEGVIPAYEEQRFRMELGIFSEWFLKGLLGISPPAWYVSLSERLVANALTQPSCCVHRDFHCRNLLVDASGDLRVVDFQDALVGPVTYDLASLLRDCYYRFEESEISAAIASYRDLAQSQGITTIADAREFRGCFDLMALQRQLKAVGIFARLWLRDQRKSHLGDLVPVLTQLSELADQYPESALLAEAITEHWLPGTAARLADLI